MNCTSCGRPLPTGVTYCPVCGAPTPYNMPDQRPSSPYDQTEIAPPYGSSQNYPPLPPTMAANSNNYPPQPQNPYTNYGAGVAPQTPYDPYNMSSGYPSSAPPPPANPVGPGPYYNAAAMPGYPPGMQPGRYNTPPKKRSKVGCIIGISVLAFLFLCGGLIVVATQLGKNSATGNNSTGSNVPTNSSVVPAAAKILFAVQTSSDMNSNYEPTHVTTTFSTGKDVDLTFQVDSVGKNGYIKVRWYEDGQEVGSNILHHDAKNDHGYFGQPYDTAGDGAAALYWCTQPSCSDEQLAQVVNFTVTGTSAVPSSSNAIAVKDGKNNNE
ncbi:MAG: zinc-ribbon domain-containing protein [Ktedonobacteraceae bacterium]|nr:zinc-ribbon domain-containing protein [Ktedonobacteraceae bacterium]